MPGPAQRLRVPLLIGAHGGRMPRITAEHADIAAFTGARPVGDSRLEALTAEELDERVARYQECASGRKEPAEVNLLIQVVEITDDRSAEIVNQVLAQRERYGFSYLTVLEPNMAVFARVVEALSGR
ncbi:hypothetical protein GCM10017771_53830 [Streptomyces capitiformicae]|uniref:Uncharacterized protein n=1 Tax=Streptomyces capitiformicae TaxID=2014920 RepID=A0A918Z4I7_9ACTN|nr:hypothetical protein GCM10017771_53830 [Streptomyces capitiformicae]